MTRERLVRSAVLVLGGLLVLVAVGRSGLGGRDLASRSEAGEEPAPQAARRAISQGDTTPWIVRRFQLAQANEAYVATVVDGVLWAAGTNGYGLTSLDRQGRRTDLGRYADGAKAATEP